MSRNSKRRNRNIKRHDMMRLIAEAAQASILAEDIYGTKPKADYSKDKGSIIAGNLARGEAGKFINAKDLMAAGKPLAVDIGIEPDTLKAMYDMTNGEAITDELRAKLFDLGVIGDDGKLSAKGRALVKAVEKNDMKLAEELAKKILPKPKTPTEPKTKKTKDKSVQKQTAPKTTKVDVKIETSMLAKSTGVDVKALDDLVSLSDGGQLDRNALNSLVSMGIVTINQAGLPKLTNDGASLITGIKSGDREAAESIIRKLKKPAEESAVQEVIMPYKLKDKCVYKENGELVKCHDTAEEAADHLKALQANVDDAREASATDIDISVGEAMKKIGDVSHPVSDFLVADDEEKPSTWRLPVKNSGKPDRALAGAAWAALFSPGGHRGQPYSGPDKSEAQRKLKALYKAEEWPMPGEETNEARMAEMWSDEIAYIPLGVKSFSDLKAAQSARKAVNTIREFSNLFPVMVDNLLSDPDLTDKQAAIKALAIEFADEVDVALKTLSNNGNGNTPADDIDMNDELGEAIAYLDVGDISESDTAKYAAILEDGKKTYAYIDIVSIKPGWGNKRDNNYYPSEVVSSEKTRDLFIGAKMYESEHNPATKDNSTWVSTIVEAVGMHSSGAPIYRAAIHDPYFTEKVNNLSKLGLLHKLECSIQGEGRALPGFSDGTRKGKRLQEFTVIHNVDWVTKAGAGGHALALVENETGGTDNMEDKRENEQLTNEAAVVESVAVNEQHEPVSEEAHKTIEATEVAKLLEVSALPEISRKRLLAGVTYSDEKEVNDAIKAEIDYLKEATGSGRPIGSYSQPTKQQTTALKESEAAKDAVNTKFLGA